MLYTIVLGPMPGHATVDTLAFEQALAKMLGCPATNLLVTTGDSSADNTTLHITLEFVAPDTRARLQAVFGNLTTDAKVQLGIQSLLAAPLFTTPAPTSNNDWTLVFVALGFICILGVIGFFVYRKLSKMLREKKQRDSTDIESFRKSMMKQFGDEGGVLDEEMLPRGRGNSMAVSKSETKEL